MWDVAEDKACGWRIEDLRLRIREKRMRLPQCCELSRRSVALDDEEDLKIEDWKIEGGMGGGDHPHPEPCLWDVELVGKISNDLVFHLW